MADLTVGYVAGLIALGMVIGKPAPEPQTTTRYLPYGATTLSQHCPLMAFGLLVINSDFGNQPEI